MSLWLGLNDRRKRRSNDLKKGEMCRARTNFWIEVGPRWRNKHRGNGEEKKVIHSRAEERQHASHVHNQDNREFVLDERHHH